MTRAHFTVSQLRVAASCPRILYFDAEHTRTQGLKAPTVTRIWKSEAGSETTACGSLFHAAIEKFNKQAANDPEVRKLLSGVEGTAALQTGLLNYVYWNCVNQDLLFDKTGPQQQAFIGVLGVYVGELADLLAFALKLKRPVDELLDELFGDRRRRVDVTFQVGPDREEVHVTGILDYVFYDYRTANRRILDYKLTTAQEPANDLFQVCTYALMHHIQHKTTPDAGLLYLHPTRTMVVKPWEEIWAERDKIYNLLASMRAWVRYDEQSGQGVKPPGEPLYCNSCRWNKECERRLGPKHEGTRLVAGGDNRAETNPSLEQPSPSPQHEPSVETVAVPGKMWIGATVAGQQAVHLPSQVLPTHVTVVGAAGSGKTWLAKVLVEEAIRQGIPVLAIDPQGDLVQFLSPSDPARLNDQERLAQVAFRQLVEPRILTPGSSHGIRVSLSPIRVASAKDLHGETDPQRRTEELEGMLATVASNLVSLAKTGGETDSQQTFVLQILQRLTCGDNTQGLQLKDVVAGLNYPEELGLDDADTFVKKSEREKLARKLNNLLHGPSANLFTGGMPLDVEQLCRPVTLGKVPLNVVYLNALPSDEQKQHFVAALAAEVYRWMVTTVHAPGRPSLLFYLDEARDYIPAGSVKPPAKMPLIRLFTQGRKYGVACLMCTQSPRSVDYNIFGNCSTKLIGRLESTQDADRVAEWFAQQGPSPSWLKERKGADPGTFIARWPGMPADLEGRAIKSRSLFSLHEGAWSPDRVEQALREDPVRAALISQYTVPGK